MTSSHFSRPGAVDLSALRRPAGGAGPDAASSSPGVYAVDVTEHTFQADVLEASLQHVVVLSLWSPRAPASEQLNETLTRLADEMAGRFRLALLDVDANPEIANALGVQGVPFVLGLLRGQPVPLFQGTVDEADARRYLEELLKVAVANGVTGRASPQAAPAMGTDEPDPAADPAADPRFAAGDEALARGDLEAAVAAYATAVEASPGDDDAVGRLAGARLVSRTRNVDPAAARAAATASPSDVAAAGLVADLDVLEGRSDEAFDRLLGLVATTSGSERDDVRRHLLELFSVVGPDDSAVAPARRRLATALF